jgi:Tfp pilus assembly protein PilX
MKAKSQFKNENGSVMVLALIILVLLTLMGISATTTSTIEVEIAGNERAYKQDFYLSEATTRLAAQQILTMAPAVLGNIGTQPWINDATNVTVDPTNINLASNIWNTTGTGLANARFTAVETTGLIDLTQPSNLHRYTIYGVYDTGGGGQVVIEIGYKRRF